MDQCDLNWSIRSSHADYTTHRNLDSLYKDMNTSILYDRLGDDDNLVSRQLKSVMKDLKKCLVVCYYDDTNDVSTTYLGTLSC